MSAFHWHGTVEPKIIDLLKKVNVTITNENIRIWPTEKMLLRQVDNACIDIKTKTNPDVLIFTNDVEHIGYFEEKHGISIYDVNDLKELAIKFDDLDLYDML